MSLSTLRQCRQVLRRAQQARVDADRSVPFGFLPINPPDCPAPDNPSLFTLEAVAVVAIANTRQKRRYVSDTYAQGEFLEEFVDAVASRG